MELEFRGDIWFWQGPAPWYFVSVPGRESRRIAAVAASVTYGWGMIPARVSIGDTAWPTALWPKDGGYIVPLKAWVRRAEGLELGTFVTVHLTIGV